MLRVLSYDHSVQKSPWLFSQEDEAPLWLVAEVDSKRWIQTELLKRYQVVPGRWVQRASEYWRWLFSIHYPDWTLISESLLFIWLEEWFEQEKVDERFQDISLFHNFFRQFLPAYVGADQGLFQDWLKETPEREQRLQPWVEVTQKFWQFLKTKKSVPSSCAASLLLEVPDLYFGEDEKVFVDLGAEITATEMELFRRWSQQKQVTVFVPRSGESQASKEVFHSVYDRFRQWTELESLENSQSSELAPCYFQTHPNVLQEVKNCVGQVRRFLDQGCLPTELAILSPNIEEYWNLLRAHLQTEGIPLQKRVVGKVSSLAVVQTWLSRLHVKKEDLQQADLETSLFDLYQKKNPSLSYELFRKNYLRIYDESQARALLAMEKPWSKSHLLETAEFVDWMYSHWPQSDTRIVDEMADQMVQELGMQNQFSLELWLKYLEMLLSRGENKIFEADPEGIWVSGLSGVDWPTLKHIFVLGGAQKHYRERVKTPARDTDIFQLENDLGVILPRVEPALKEWELLWLLRKPCESFFLSRSETDFEGQPQTASSLWLSLQQQGQTISSLEDCRWDRLMQSDMKPVTSDLDLESDEPLLLQKRQRDLQEPMAPWQLRLSHKPSLSASSFKKLHDCGFKFYAEKGLGLKEPSVYDLEIDVMYQGQILHALLEEIAQRENLFELSQSELEDIYRRAVEAVPLEAQNKNFWLLEKERHFQHIHHFLELEIQWREAFPQSRVLGAEVDILGFIGIQEGQLSFSKIEDESHPYAFRGKIDRLEKDRHGHLSIVDYKTSGGSLKSIDSWAEEGQFQMALYAACVESGLCDEVPAAEVVAATYLFLKEKKRGKGFILKDVEHELAEPEGPRSKAMLSRQEKSEHFARIFAETKKSLEKLGQGDFAPVPRDKKICDTCHWSLVCRAPHLK